MQIKIFSPSLNHRARKSSSSQRPLGEFQNSLEGLLSAEIAIPSCFCGVKVEEGNLPSTLPLPIDLDQRRKRSKPKPTESLKINRLRVGAFNEFRTFLSSIIKD